jgi:alkylated DNA repair dioxygenase AlkB
MQVIVKFILLIINYMFQEDRHIHLKNADITFIEHFFEPKQADILLKKLLENIQWQQGEITIFGKKVAEPRLSAWYGDVGKSYTYSGKKQEPLAWIEPLLDIKIAIESYLNTKNFTQNTEGVLFEQYVRIIDGVTSSHPVNNTHFNSVLCNFYRNGNDSMGYHADNERELGQNPIIASINLGDTRRFIFRRKDDPKKKYELALTHGSLLIMAGEMQHFWQHGVPKEKEKKERINLTFRHIM